MWNRDVRIYFISSFFLFLYCEMPSGFLFSSEIFHYIRRSSYIANPALFSICMILFHPYENEKFISVGDFNTSIHLVIAYQFEIININMFWTPYEYENYWFTINYKNVFKNFIFSLISNMLRCFYFCGKSHLEQPSNPSNNSLILCVLSHKTHNHIVVVYLIDRYTRLQICWIKILVKLETKLFKIRFF